MSLFTDSGGERFGRAIDAGDFVAVGVGSYYKYRQTAVDAHPTVTITVASGRMAVGGMQLSCLYVEAHPPAISTVGDRRKQNPRPTVTEHATQPSGVIMHRNCTDNWEGYRPWPAAFPHADCGFGALALFVSDPK
jgi:hypothetical protein